MSIKRYTAEADTTIADAFKPDMINRSTTSNMGLSDSLEIFSIYQQVLPDSLEKSRMLIQFPTSNIIADRTSGNLPASGSVKFFLKLFNVKHPFTLPKEYNLSVFPISGSWIEGYGLDLDEYSDLGFGETNGYGTNWRYRISGSSWTEYGGDYYADREITQFFKEGYEDLNVDVTSIVEEWVSGSLPNDGFLIKLQDSYEDASRKQSYYTKKFSARGTQYFFSRPVIEAQWDDSITDTRNSYTPYIHGMNIADATNTVYFYNRAYGNLINLNTTGGLPVFKLYSDAEGTSKVSTLYNTVISPSVGIYKAQFATSAAFETLYDRWHESGSNRLFFSGSIKIRQDSDRSDSYSEPEYIMNITNLKSSYSNMEKSRINIYSREKNWQPTIYTVASNNIENTSLKNLYYRIFRIDDNYEVLPYTTGAIQYTKVSYDKNGNYFTLDMSLLEPDYSYGINLGQYINGGIKQYKNTFKFRVK